MGEEVEFNARLLRNNQIQIPKRIVENLQLWVGTRVKIWLWTPRHVEFKTTVKQRFRFTIPKLELAGGRLKPGDIVAIHLTKLELPKA